ncbi:MAG TPA: hypothetical protein VGM37_05370 [Armatimonadota bacterium]|jgi:hypothetical protein
MNYEEKQRFRQWWMWAILLPSLGAPMGVAGYWAFAHYALGRTIPNLNPGSPDPGPALVIAFLALGAPLWMMWAAELRIRVRPDALHVSFFPFMRERRFLYSQILRAEARTYNPVGEYGGWGLKGTGKNRALNVSGNRGVQLELVSGQRLLLGSQRPDELAAAINARR